MGYFIVLGRVEVSKSNFEIVGRAVKYLIKGAGVSLMQNKQRVEKIKIANAKRRKKQVIILLLLMSVVIVLVCMRIWGGYDGLL